MSEARVRAAFLDQAKACRALGSPFTADLCASLADDLKAGQGAVAAKVLGWTGDPSARADSVPLRLCGGLHALVLTGADAALTESYHARQVDRAAILAALVAHEAMLMGWLDSPPQTNEVARSAAIIAAARFASGLSPLPIRALELGASAGLNLNFHRYHLQAQDRPPPAPSHHQPEGRADGQAVVLTPHWQGEVPGGTLRVASAEGVDLRPLDARRDGLRLMAYCWADQDLRLARLRAALELARDYPPQVAAGDAGDWLAERLAQPAPGRLTLVYHTIAAQYFPPATQAACEAALARAGAAASPDAALAHFAMEADGGDGAALTLRVWDGSPRGWRLGRADFHGRWIRWAPVPN
ncbi:DUF2332 domain-containing protein [Paracoccus marinaquae]|uniref:DUF2332 family protein n=1 Tax=Paracoccus marinaquae TaxID=2841926 RepID=A0ABS6AIW9_9RHOB|nr:DUF2332 family protein [Paracoccus marinaquae]MBU3029331.1 DUF2332 family protein [Paracoccus marinaquae]